MWRDQRPETVYNNLFRVSDEISIVELYVELYVDDVYLFHLDWSLPIFPCIRLVTVLDKHSPAGNIIVLPSDRTTLKHNNNGNNMRTIPPG